MWNLGVGKWIFVVSSSLIFKCVWNILCNRQNIINGRVNYSWRSKWRHGIIPGRRKQTKENVHCRCEICGLNFIWESRLFIRFGTSHLRGSQKAQGTSECFQACLHFWSLGLANGWRLEELEGSGKRRCRT